MAHGFENARYLNLETYRRDGSGVRTPVWFAQEAGGAAELYAYTTVDAGKTKRIRRNGAARIAPCDFSGKPVGPWVDAAVEIVGGEEFGRGMRLLDRKYFPWKQLLGLSAMLFRRRERVVLRIRPTAELSPSQ